MKTELTAGVIGVGSMGRHHVRIYNDMDDVQLAGVADEDKEAAESVAAEYETSAWETEALLDEVDMVSIAVPTRFHYPLARKAITRGVHTLVEKPLTKDPEKGRTLVQGADSANVVLQVGHVERYNPAVRTLADIVPDLNVIAVEARRLGPPVDRDITDSAVLDLMIHDIDVVCSLVEGDVAGVTASGTSDGQHIAATLDFADGVVGNLTASRVTQQKIRDLAVTAESCRVHVDYADQTVHIHRHSVPEYVATDGDVRYRHESVIEQPTVDNGEPLAAELESFAEAIRTGDAPTVTGEDGLRALRIAREIDAQAKGRESPQEPPHQ
jgi:predicted dehydrogenase